MFRCSASAKSMAPVQCAGINHSRIHRAELPCRLWQELSTAHLPGTPLAQMLRLHALYSAPTAHMLAWPPRGAQLLTLSRGMYAERCVELLPQLEHIGAALEGPARGLPVVNSPKPVRSALEAAHAPGIARGGVRRTRWPAEHVLACTQRLHGRRYTAYGAVVGGPSSLNSSSFPDTRRQYQYMEPSLDYGGGLTGALAILTGYYEDQRPATMCNLDLGYGTLGAPPPAASLVTQCGNYTSGVHGR